jgi:hypothetical protein
VRIQTRNRLFVTVAILILLMCCGAAFAGLALAKLGPSLMSIVFDDVVGVQLARVMDTTVIRELRYVDGDFGDVHVAGPHYALTFEVPEAWVYHVRTHINGPSLLFEALTGENEMRVSPDLATPIVTVTALASETYQREAQDAWWDGVAARTDDTVFVWTVHGLDHAFKADVPRVIKSIKVIALD